jgi:hypothetical protein
MRMSTAARAPPSDNESKVQEEAAGKTSNDPAIVPTEHSTEIGLGLAHASAPSMRWGPQVCGLSDSTRTSSLPPHAARVKGGDLQCERDRLHRRVKSSVEPAARRGRMGFSVTSTLSFWFGTLACTHPAGAFS